MNNAPPSQRRRPPPIAQSLLWLWLIGLLPSLPWNHQAMNGLG